MLENMKIARPCGADWAAMSGDERVRFCGLCQLNVYNLSGMSRADAEALVQKSEGRVCVRFFQRADGKVLTQDCPIGLAAVKRRVALAAASVLSFISLGVGAVLGYKALDGARWKPGPALTPTHCQPKMGEVMMGKVSFRPPKPQPPQAPPAQANDDGD